MAENENNIKPQAQNNDDRPKNGNDHPKTEMTVQKMALSVRKTINPVQKMIMADRITTAAAASAAAIPVVVRITAAITTAGHPALAVFLAVSACVLQAENLPVTGGHNAGSVPWRTWWM